jgi:hypothetical protein
MTSFLRTAATAAFTFAAFAAIPAQAATLIGDSITADYRFSNIDATGYPEVVTPSATFTVGAGIEATGNVDGSNEQSFDFDATSLTLTVLDSVGWTSASFNGWVFINNSKNYDPITSVTGIDAGRVSIYQNNKLAINWQGLGYQGGEVIVVNFGPGGAVPEPATWASAWSASPCAAAKRSPPERRACWNRKGRGASPGLFRYPGASTSPGLGPMGSETP